MGTKGKQRSASDGPHFDHVACGVAHARPEATLLLGGHDAHDEHLGLTAVGIGCN